MSKYTELKQLLKSINGDTIPALIQAEVVSVQGELCTVKIGDLEISEVRLRASTKTAEGKMLITPKVNTNVLLGSLSGDLRELAVIKVDEAETVVINGGTLGGLIKINEITTKLNELVTTFNDHTHDVPTGSFLIAAPNGVMQPAPKPVSKPKSIAAEFKADDYKDDLVTH